MVFPARKSLRAFTLIELLVVIAILGILMTLMIPAVTGALEQAKKTQAKNDAAQLATAITAYMTEYGRVPIASSEQINKSDGSLMNILTGQDATNNPRQIVFLEVPKAKAGKNGAESSGAGYTSAYKDSWGNDYEVRVDDDYDNVIKTGPSGDVRKTVIVWSKGNPARAADYSNPAKYIKSWE